ncbi:hypothetical protein NEF87_004964 [Candidatus Lokiarchaeum ossiferum]|uniref:YkgJ family cysteine cluster protein n=1 Tax=Candidatus Lokiarchaeum ossiferum TaxID=2951803 RepID=A0ABY6I1I4_9ARCH|nr:hypothetical protein NEF87_004964 [Candidatus Lokiarchaeum sp. B-35]
MELEILRLVKSFNEIIRNSITGPDCLDPQICLGDCCFIQIPVPKALASYYIQQGWAKKTNFKRGTEFSFVMAADLSSLRCVFFDKSLNGCSLHMSGYKAPQCWVYPTGLDIDTLNHSCKKASGWNTENTENLSKAKEILTNYVKICKEEAHYENSAKQILHRLHSKYLKELPNLTPYQVTGLQDSWDRFNILIGDGYSMGMKHFCDKVKCSESYFQCEKICIPAYNQFLAFYELYLSIYIENFGFKQDYPIIELKKVENLS